MAPSFDADLLERKPQSLKACGPLNLQSLTMHRDAMQVWELWVILLSYRREISNGGR